MYVWVHMCMSSTHHINPSAIGHFLTLGGALKEEGKGRRGKRRGELPGSQLPPSVLFLPHPILPSRWESSSGNLPNERDQACKCQNHFPNGN